ncbi:PREDICTED: protein zwilch homolog [Priapulus caudatus]|uniref:Protein zwilch n=1 Tax=Priapulus caudatus TaxID=37621 RepID=A0ABM1E326_PRICU|nr:PREDICTED: protein zwilch homolog [Priapulus caudatus]
MRSRTQLPQVGQFGDWMRNSHIKDHPSHGFFQEYSLELKSVKAGYPILASSAKQEDIDIFLLQGIQHQQENVNQEQQLDESECSSQPPCTPTDGASCFELGGSPLKTSFMDLATGKFKTPEKRKPRSVKGDWYPIDSARARYFLSLYALACNPCIPPDDRVIDSTVEDLPPLWVLCNGHDVEHTVYVGSEVVKRKDYMGLSTYTVTIDGPFEKHSRSIMTIEDVVKSNLWGGYHSLGPTKAHASFVLLGDHWDNKSSNIELDIRWEMVHKVLQKPPNNAAATAHVKIVPGDPTIPTYALYKELRFLKNLHSALTIGEITWQNDNNESTTLAAVKMLIEEFDVRLDNTRKEEKDDLHNDTRQLMSDSNAMLQRVDLDFTDKLWNILIESSSYTELLDSFREVFTALQAGHIEPMVNQRNNTQLARLVRDSYSGKMATPDLTGALPLQLLLEIGIEKLTVDYVTAFLATEVVHLFDLDYYLATSRADYGCQLRVTEKLHAVAELLVLCKVFLELPDKQLGIFARHALKQMEHSDDEEPEFTMPLPFENVMSSCQSDAPAMWGIEVSTERDQQYLTTRYELSTAVPFPHMWKEDAETGGSSTRHTDGRDEDVRYFCTLIRHSHMQFL